MDPGARRRPQPRQEPGVRESPRPLHREPAPLTAQDLLATLLENAGRVVTQRDLLEQVWGREYINDIYYPRVYVSQLRRKVEPDPANPVYILTEHRIGYRFEKQSPLVPKAQ